MPFTPKARPRPVADDSMLPSSGMGHASWAGLSVMASGFRV